MKKRIITGIFLILFILSFLVGCGCTNNKVNVVSKGKITNSDNSKWTIFVYICGGSLEEEYGCASDNLKEMVSANLSDNINVVVQTGGTKEWQTDGINPSKLQRFEVRNNSLNLIEEKENASMGSANTLGEFLDWGIKNYKSEKYALVFYGDGGGIFGFGVDENYKSDNLTLNELSEGISKSNVQFDLIGFDTSLMANLENAKKISPYGKYMVASEEYSPKEGWNYTEIINYISENTDCTGDEIGRLICDSYYSKCKNNENEIMATLSLIDLSKIEELDNQFQILTSEILEVSNNDISKLGDIIQKATLSENYGGNCDNEGYSNMVDLKNLTQNVNTILEETQNNIISDFESTIIYKVNGDGRKNSNGLSTFFPLSINGDVCNKYAEISQNEDYLKLLDLLCKDWNYTENKDTPTNYNVQISTSLGDDGYFKLKIENGIEIVKDVKFSLYYANEQDNSYILLGNNDKVKNDAEQNEFINDFTGDWIKIGEQLVAYNVISENEDYILYSIPVMVNDDYTNIRVIYNYKNNKFKIIGLYNMGSRSINKLKDGDKVSFISSGLNTETNEKIMYSVGNIVWKSDTTVSKSNISNGNYIYVYEVEDIFGNKISSDKAIMEYKNNKINFYAVEK